MMGLAVLAGYGIALFIVWAINDFPVHPLVRDFIDGFLRR